MACDHNHRCTASCRQPRPDPRSRGPREQPERRQRRPAEAQAERVHRGVRVRQEFAGVQHHRSRVAADDQRDLQLVPAGLHADARPARRRPSLRVDHGHHRRPGADGRQLPLHRRYRHGCQRPAADPLQPPRHPHIGSPQAFSFNVASISGAGAVQFEKGGQTVKERRDFTITGGQCPRCEGMGTVNDFDLTELYDDSRSLGEGALTVPGYSMDGWYGRIFSGSGYFDMDKPISKFTKKELNDLLYREPTKIKVEGINLTYSGLIPQIQKSYLSKDREAMQPHIRAFVDRVITFSTCPECVGTRLNEGAHSSKIVDVNIADACRMQISDLAEWVRGLDEPSVAPLRTSLREALDSFVEIGLGYLSLERPAST